MRSRAVTLLVLATLSGVFGINYEVLFFRLITARFGDMVYVQAAVLAMFLLGFAIGAKIGYRLRWLWALELLVGITSMGVSVGLAAVEAQPWLVWVLQRPVLAAGLCMLLVAVPATLVGCSIPLFSEYVAWQRKVAGVSAFHRVYALYNLGAAFSVLATEYLLVRSSGNGSTLGLLAWGNISIGLTLFVFFPEFRRGAAVVHGQPTSTARLPRRKAGAILLIGCASSIFQMVFIRGAMEVFGNTREIFALTLCLVLAGLALGVHLSRRLDLKDAIHLATISIAVGFVLLPYLEAFHRDWFQQSTSQSEFLSWLPMRVVWRLVILAPLGLLPFACFGTLLPFALKNFPSAARPIGEAMWLNGLGNAAGYLLFIGPINNIFPELGQIFVVVALAQGGIALDGGGSVYRRSPTNQWLVPAGAAILLLVAYFRTDGYYARQLGQQASYRRDEALAGPFTVSLHVERKDGTSAGIVHYRDGASLENKRLFYSGHTSIPGVERGRIREGEVLSGVLPALFAPSLRRAAVVGVGTGITAGTTARLFERTDAVEINAAVLRLLPRFADANFDLLRNPAARIIHNDARVYLASSGPVYDVVLNSVSVPSFEAASKIYTTEFFHQVKRSLAPGGVYMTWVNMNDAALSPILASLRSAFRRCFATYLSPGYFMLTCADHTLRPRPLSSITLPFAIRNALAEYPNGRTDLDEFISSLHLTDDFFATVPPGHVQNTDDLPIAEFAAGDPRIGSTILLSWPAKNSGFLTIDYVSGRRIDGDALWNRCNRYRQSDLREACAGLPSLDSVFVRSMLDGGFQTSLDAPRPDPTQAMRARWELIDHVIKRRGTDSAFVTRRDSLTLALADVLPNDADIQEAASRVLAGLPAGATVSELRHYRAFVLDSRYRIFNR